jgi:hypothetical protein
MFASNHHTSYPQCITKNHLDAVDAHFQNGAVAMSLSLLPIDAVSM